MSKFSVITVYAVSACFLLHSILSGLFVIFFFPLLVRLCTKYEMHRGREEKKQKTKKYTTARSRTWTGSLCGKSLVLRLFIRLSDALWLFMYNPQRRAGRLGWNGWEINQFDQSVGGRGGGVSRANWGRTSYAERHHVVWCPAWQLKARIWWSHVVVMVVVGEGVRWVDGRGYKMGQVLFIYSFFFFLLYSTYIVQQGAHRPAVSLRKTDV